MSSQPSPAAPAETKKPTDYYNDFYILRQRFFRQEGVTEQELRKAAQAYIDSIRAWAQANGKKRVPCPTIADLMR